jgi:hypothetical protein
MNCFWPLNTQAFCFVNFVIIIIKINQLAAAADAYAYALVGALVLLDGVRGTPAAQHRAQLHGTGEF